MMSRRALSFATIMALGGIFLSSSVAAQQVTPPISPSAHRSATARPVLLISVDGLPADTLLEADRLGLKIPVLRQFMKEGASADRVINVNPTVTNPNHTTLVTGVSPRLHGIYNNRPFAATASLPKGFSKYSDIKAPTLWAAAKAAGLQTGSIFWPVTEDATDIDFNIRTGSSTDDKQIATEAVSLIERSKPELLTVHFVSHDSAQHKFGAGTPEGFAALERIDAAIGEVITAQRKAYPESVIAIVSDHGFYPVNREVQLNSAFVDAGLITLDKGATPEVAQWRAFAWYVGGSAMVVLKDPQDAKLQREVRQFLRKLAANPDAGIERIYDAKELEGRGLSPQAQFLIALKSGYRMGNAMTGPLCKAFHGGAHGAFSTETIRPEMHSIFLIAGPDIAPGEKLGIIDMRAIAPTLAGALGVPLPSATEAPIALRGY